MSHEMSEDLRELLSALSSKLSSDFQKHLTEMGIPFDPDEIDDDSWMVLNCEWPYSHEWNSQLDWVNNWLVKHTGNAAKGLT